jgi:hypothetical protein
MKEKNIAAKREKRMSSIFLLLAAALLFGLAGSFAGIIFARPYFVNNIYNAPIAGESSASQDSLRQANSIIENAKKIIIGQENKINETINSSQNSLIGVFLKNEAAATSSAAQIKDNKFNIANYYKLDEEVGEGLVVTSDGWILATDFSNGANENLIAKNYIAITKNKNIYSIDKIARSGIDSYLFIHLADANELPVKVFVSKTDLTNSQSLVALNWRSESYLTSIVDKKEKSQEVRDSDRATENIVLSNNLGNYFDNAFIFSLNNEVVGFFDKKSGLIPLDSFQPLIRGLLEKTETKLPSLGVTYVNLEDFAIKNPGYEKGALIYASGKTPAIKEGGAASTAQLLPGDIIVSIDNFEISGQKDLADIIQKYSAGDTINMIYRRGGQEKSVKIKLGELK